LAGVPEINERQTALAEHKAALDKQIANIDVESAEVHATPKALDVNVAVIYLDLTLKGRIVKIKA
jgi:hypothetical protein